MNESDREWIIQRCVNAFHDEYENWPGYCERLLTREEMKAKLAECNARWPDDAFRGHKVGNPRPKRPELRLIRQEQRSHGRLVDRGVRLIGIEWGASAAAAHDVVHGGQRDAEVLGDAVGAQAEGHQEIVLQDVAGVEFGRG